MDFSRELSLLEVGAGLGVVALCLIVESDHPQGSLGGRRRYAAMHARMSTLEGLPDEMDEGLHDVKEHVLPLLRQQDGFKGFIALGNRQSDELIGITFWESKLCRPARKSEIVRAATQRRIRATR
jgi:heme-degrading monooxygenase HmoA